MKFKTRNATAAILLAASVAPLMAAGAAQPARPLLPVFDAATITARCDGELAAVRQQQKAMEARKGAGTIFAELNALSIRFAEFAYPVYLLQNVAPDKATRDAAQACLEKVLPFETELYQSAALYKRVKAVKPKDPDGHRLSAGPVREVRGRRRDAAARQAQARQRDHRRTRATVGSRSRRTSTRTAPPSRSLRPKRPACPRPGSPRASGTIRATSCSGWITRRSCRSWSSPPMRTRASASGWRSIAKAARRTSRSSSRR